MTFSEFFTEAVSVDAVISSRDAGGGTALAFTSKATAVPCSILVDTGGEEVAFDQTQLPNSATLVTESAVFERGDRVTVTTGEGLVGAVFRVVGIGSQPGSTFLGIGAMVNVSLKGWQ